MAGREHGLGHRVVPSREPDLPGRADGFRIPRDAVREREPTGLVCEVLQAGRASRERSQVRQTKARRPLQRGAGVPRGAAARRGHSRLQAVSRFFPGDVQALAGLAAIYSQQGKRSEAGALYGQILEHADSAEANDLFSAAQAILNAIPNEPDTAPMGSACRAATRARNKTLTVKQVATRCAAVTDDTIKAFRTTLAAPRYRLAARAYEAGLAKNPNLREALYNLGGIYYLLDDTAKALPVAQRLYAVDPLNRTSLAKLAGAWQLRASKDSTLLYLTIADSMTVEVTIGTFSPDEQGAKLDGLFTNLKTKASLPAGVTFEFLNAKGDVVATQKQDVPAIDASGSHAFEIKAAGAGIVAWRYRRS